MKTANLKTAFLAVMLAAGPVAAADAVPGVPLTAGSAAGFAPKGWKPVPGAQVAADIDGDGRADLAFLLGDPDGERVLVVALGTGKGYRRIAAGSGPVLMPVQQPQLRFAQGTLVLEQVSDGPTPLQTVHRFRYDAASGRMRLIGEDLEAYTRPLRQDTHKSSTNWLTGERVITIGVEKDGTIAATRSYKSRVAARTIHLEDVVEPRDALSDAMKPYWKTAASVPAADAEVPCDIAAEVIDKDPKGLNVRAGPGAKHPVTGTLPTTHGVVIEVSSASGQWMRVRSAADGREEKDYGKQQAWVFGPLLGFDAWSRGKVRAVPMRAEPDPSAKIVAEVPQGRQVVLTGCSGRWARGRYEGREGWLAPEHRCANPFTECN